MNRTDKTEFVERLNENFRTNPHLILSSFRGLTVNQATALRQKVSDAGGSLSVIKNRLARLAASGTPAEEMSGKFDGPCMVAFHASDPVVLAKTISEFGKENPQIEMIAGLVDAKELLDQSGVKQLASLPGLPELRAQLLALFQTPATTLVRLLQTPGGQLARVIDARREQQEGGA